MNQDHLKKAAAQAAIKYVVPDEIIGVGTGSTVNYFIEELAKIKNQIEGAVASSESTAKKLKAHHIAVYDLNAVNDVAVYIDGADEFNEHSYLIKGGGGALTREKIIATVAKKFVCIVDENKRVGILGTHFPVPIEVIPMARSYVGRQIIKMHGDPVYRENFVTDNGNIILDAHNLKLIDPLEIESEIKKIVGVVENGIFAQKRPDIILISTANGIQEQKK